MRLDPVRLSNPMSVEQSVMRTMLLPGLLGAVRDNLDRLNDPPNLFEIGQRLPVGRRRGGLRRRTPPSPARCSRTSRRPWASCSAARCRPRTGRGTGRPTDFYTLKGIVESVLRTLRLDGHFAPLGDAAAMFPYLHPGKAALVGVAPGVGVGVLGMLRPDVAAAYGIEDLELYVASLNMERLAQVALRSAAFEDLGTYPPAVQDLAVVLDRDVPAAEVVAIARKAGGKLTRDVRVFDVYEGDQVPAGKRSLALRLVMRSPERTLTEKDITEVRRRVLQALERELGATLR